MGIDQRLARLEKRFPKPAEPQWPDFYSIDPYGLDHSAYLRLFTRRLRELANDPRATEEERYEWVDYAKKIEAGLPPEGTTA